MTHYPPPNALALATVAYPNVFLASGISIQTFARGAGVRSARPDSTNHQYLATTSALHAYQQEAGGCLKQGIELVRPALVA